MLETRRGAASAKGAWIEAPKAPRGWCSWGVYPSQPTRRSWGASWAPPAGSRAKPPRPPTHSRHISGPQMPSSRNNVIQYCKIWKTISWCQRNLYGFFSVQKGGPPKIGGPVRPNTSNMPKAGPECQCAVKWDIWPLPNKSAYVGPIIRHVNGWSMFVVLGPACNEYNNLTSELEVERACRTEAEKIATHVRSLSVCLWGCVTCGGSSDNTVYSFFHCIHNAVCRGIVQALRIGEVLLYDKPIMS